MGKEKHKECDIQQKWIEYYGKPFMMQKHAYLLGYAFASKKSTVRDYN